VHAAVAFYTKTVLMSIQQAESLTDSFIAQLTTWLIKGLKSKNEEYRCASYMVISTICSKVRGLYISSIILFPLCGGEGRYAMSKPQTAHFLRNDVNTSTIIFHLSQE